MYILTETFDYSKKNEGKSTNIVWSEGLITTEERQQLTNRTGATIWVTGLSGSGKSTIACLLEQRLLEEGHNAYRLDGDNIRFALNKDLGFSEADREVPHTNSRTSHIVLSFLLIIFKIISSSHHLIFIILL